MFDIFGGGYEPGPHDPLEDYTPNVPALPAFDLTSCFASDGKSVNDAEVGTVPGSLKASESIQALDIALLRKKNGECAPLDVHLDDIADQLDQFELVELYESDLAN